jgi:hypothetical protein
MRILFGQLQPDQPDLLNSDLEEAENCVPYAQGYGPFYDATPYSDSVSGTACGAVSAKDISGNTYTFVGTQKKLYSEASQTISNVSRTATYTTASDGRWEFATFGNTFLAVNGIDPLQVYTLGTSTQFLNASASASAPIAANIAVVRDFVFLGNLSTGKNRAQWSRINNPLRYGFDQRYQSDFQDFPGENQNIVKITGGDFGTILTENSAWRASYVGSPLVFRFDEVAPGIGCIAAGSVARFQSFTFYLSADGFYVFDGTQAQPIGKEKIDQKFLAEADLSRKYRWWSMFDPINKMYLMAYTSVNSSNDLCDRIIAYNWDSKRWTFITEPSYVLFTHYTAGFTLEQLDTFGSIDDLPFSLDSSVWQGGNLKASCIMRSGRIGRFEGDAKTARFVTGEGQLVPENRAFVRNIRPLVQGFSIDPDGAVSSADQQTEIAVQVGQRDRLIDSVSWNPGSSLNAIGDCPVRSNARYHRFRMTVSGGFERAMGMDVDFVKEGKR